MVLHRALADAEVGRDVLARVARQDQHHDLALPARRTSLLVENDALISEVLAELLAGAGTGSAPRQRRSSRPLPPWRSTRPTDLMTVDAQLKDGSGVSAMQAILQHSDMPHIFMTGGWRQNIPAGALVLQKPFGKAGLVGGLECGAWRSAAPA